MNKETPAQQITRLETALSYIQGQNYQLIQEKTRFHHDAEAWKRVAQNLASYLQNLGANQ